MGDRNVLGGELEPCGSEPLTGFYRDGSCTTGPEDIGSHTICAVMTAEFLAHQRGIGNDLSTPLPQFAFPGLAPGDRWCVTAANWLRAHRDGAAAPVVLACTHVRALEIVPLEVLRQYSVDVPADAAALEELPPGPGAACSPPPVLRSYSRGMTDTDRPGLQWHAIAAQRAADADRDAVAERLRIAAGEGRIELWELDERLGRAYRARTYGDLAVLVSDLPAGPPFTSYPGMAAEPETLTLRTTTPNIRQSGRWIVPQRITAESTTGWITIDFTAASCAYREVTVEVVTRTGWIQLILPDGWAARVGPLSTYTGHISNRAAETADPGAPTVMVTGHPLFGYIKIRQRRRRR